MNAPPVKSDPHCRRLGAALFLLTTVLVAPRTGAADPPSENHVQAVRHLLLPRRVFPAAKYFLATGRPKDTNRALTEIAINRLEDPKIRLNAIRALEYFRSRRTEEVLMTLLYSRGQRPSFKRVCLRSLARTFGVDMYFEVLPFLRNDEVKVREGAALALGEIPDPRVRGVLANHLVVEQELTVRIAIEQAIDMVDARERKHKHPIAKTL